MSEIATAKGERRHLVLIVDDDQAVRDALRFALQLEGFETHSHQKGADVLADADLGRTSCIIVSDRLPFLDGFDLLKSLRAKYISLPTILLTSHAKKGVLARAAALGVQKVLEKPLLNNVLIDSLAEILGGEGSAT